MAGSLDPAWASRLFDKLLQLAPYLIHTECVAQASAPGQTPLRLDVVWPDAAALLIVLSFGDIEVEVGVFFREGAAEAIASRKDAGEQIVYPDGKTADPQVRQSVNEQLESLIDRLLAQGYVLPRGR